MKSLAKAPGSHAHRRRHTQQAQAIGQHLAGGQQQRQPGVAQSGIIHQKTLGVVVGVEISGQVFQPERERMRGQFIGGLGNHLGIGGQPRHQRKLPLGRQRRQAHGAQAGLQGSRTGAHGLGEHRADPGMRVLHVIDRVFIGARHGQIDIEHEFAVGLALDEKEANRIAASAQGFVAGQALGRGAVGGQTARPFDEVAQRDVTARALGDLDLFTAPHDGT